MRSYVLPFCRAVNEEEPTEGEKEVLDCVEAFVDRDCGTGRARDRQGKHHRGCSVAAPARCCSTSTGPPWR